MKKAFTLAEVLITLGIIGVVAAMTLPTLIRNYEKKVAAIRLHHFSSLMQQAARMRTKDVINGDFQEFNTTEIAKYNPDDMEKFFNRYWKPYVKTVSTKKLTKGLAVELANGSGAYFYRTYANPNATSCGANSYMVFCTHYKYCEAFDEKMEYNTRNIFAFWNGGTVPREYIYMPYTREEVLARCKTNPYYCASLIEMDGWTIKKDYPW